MSLKPGEDVPNFEFIDQQGNKKMLYDVPGKKIIFFFPKAFTSGCTRQSISVQENYSEIKNMGISEIFGISLDSKTTLDKFADKYDFEYVFVSDKNGSISKSFGVYRNKILFKFADRDTFIVNEDNIIEKVLHNGLMGKSCELGLENHGEEIKLNLS